ncbi:MAG: hypothetical protein ABSA72_11450, partial [Nitrososphaerales archaeon]
MGKYKVLANSADDVADEAAVLLRTSTKVRTIEDISAEMAAGLGTALKSGRSKDSLLEAFDPLTRAERRWAAADEVEIAAGGKVDWRKWSLGEYDPPGVIEAAQAARSMAATKKTLTELSSTYRRGEVVDDVVTAVAVQPEWTKTVGSWGTTFGRRPPRYENVHEALDDKILRKAQEAVDAIDAELASAGRLSPASSSSSFGSLFAKDTVPLVGRPWSGVGVKATEFRKVSAAKVKEAKVAVTDWFREAFSRMTRLYPNKRFVEIPGQLADTQSKGNLFKYVDQGIPIMRRAAAKKAMAMRKQRITELVAQLGDRPLGQTIDDFAKAFAPQFALANKGRRWDMIPKNIAQMEGLLLHVSQAVKKDKLLDDILVLGSQKLRRGTPIWEDKRYMELIVERLTVLKEIRPAKQLPTGTAAKLRTLREELKEAVVVPASGQAPAVSEQAVRHGRSLFMLLDKSDDILEDVANDELLSWTVEVASRAGTRNLLTEGKVGTLVEIGQRAHELTAAKRLQTAWELEEADQRQRRSAEVEDEAEDAVHWMFASSNYTFFLPEDVLAMEVVDGEYGGVVMVLDEEDGRSNDSLAISSNSSLIIRSLMSENISDASLDRQRRFVPALAAVPSLLLTVVPLAVGAHKEYAHGLRKHRKEQADMEAERAAHEAKQERYAEMDAWYANHEGETAGDDYDDEYFDGTAAAPDRRKRSLCRTYADSLTERCKQERAENIAVMEEKRRKYQEMDEWYDQHVGDLKDLDVEYELAAEERRSSAAAAVAGGLSPRSRRSLRQLLLKLARMFAVRTSTKRSRSRRTPGPLILLPWVLHYYTTIKKAAEKPLLTAGGDLSPREEKAAENVAGEEENEDEEEEEVQMPEAEALKILREWAANHREQIAPRSRRSSISGLDTAVLDVLDKVLDEMPDLGAMLTSPVKEEEKEEKASKPQAVREEQVAAGADEAALTVAPRSKRSPFLDAIVGEIDEFLNELMGAGEMLLTSPTEEE